MKSISNTISKGSLLEEMTMFHASMADAAHRLAEDVKSTASISDEQICPGEEILETYQVVSEAIEGGMGSVWKVHHKSWDTDLAMKRPQPAFFTEGGRHRKEEFILECEHWIRLGLHPHIVSCYYVREISGVPSIFSEWMDNGSLKDRIRDKTLYEGTNEEVQKRLLDIAIQSARGLRYSQENGLIHQDVKSGNLLLTKEWNVKVADFGLAKTRGTQADVGRALSTGYTREYCPREQAEGGEARPWMDVYAWALTMLEMYAGERFWDTGEGAFRILFGGPPRPDERKWYVSPPQKLLDAFRQDYEKSASGTAGPDSCWHSFSEMEELLTQIYLDTTGEVYPREDSKAASDTADSLNNLALSYLDLGMESAARICWWQALTADPVHFDASVNEGLYLWRRAEITDQEMAERIWYFGTLFEYVLPDNEARKHYRAVRDQFFAEVQDGVEGFVPFGHRIERDENQVRGEGTPRLQSLFDLYAGKVHDIRLEGDRIIYDVTEWENEEPVHRLRMFDIRSGECLSAADLEDQTVEQALERLEEQNKDFGCRRIPDLPPEGEYLFSVLRQEEDRDGCGRVLQIREQPGGKILRTNPVRSWDSWEDEEGKVHRSYPLIFADYEHHRLVFASLTDTVWSCFQMPVPAAQPEYMPWQVSRPVPFGERNAQDQERDRYRQGFQAALETEDFGGMLSAYNGIWQLPLTGDNRAQAWMNEELMRLCRLPGTYDLGNGIQVCISGHDPEDPLPVGMYGILPLDPSGTENPLPDLEGEDDLPLYSACRDDSNIFSCFVPWQEEDSSLKKTVKAFYWDKREKKLHECLIHFGLQDQYIRRVIAVSSRGRYLVLELGSCPEKRAREGAGESLTIVCATVNGRWMAEVVQVPEDAAVRAVFMEDGQYGPDRGYIWLPCSRKVLYFAKDQDQIYIHTDPTGWEHDRDIIPLPEELIPAGEYDVYHNQDFSHRGASPALESILLSPDGNRMGIIALEKRNQWESGTEVDAFDRTFFLYRREKGTWDAYPFGRADRILATRDLGYILVGKAEGAERRGWSWRLYPGIMKRKQQPLWELREFSPVSRIDSFSYDHCSLLDQYGRPIYAVCWQYKEGVHRA